MGPGSPGSQSDLVTPSGTSRAEGARCQVLDAPVQLGARVAALPFHQGLAQAVGVLGTALRAQIVCVGVGTESVREVPVKPTPPPTVPLVACVMFPGTQTWLREASGLGQLLLPSQPPPAVCMAAPWGPHTTQGLLQFPLALVTWSPGTWGSQAVHTFVDQRQ